MKYKLIKIVLSDITEDLIKENTFHPWYRFPINNNKIYVVRESNQRNNLRYIACETSLDYGTSSITHFILKRDTIEIPFLPPLIIKFTNKAYAAN